MPGHRIKSPPASFRVKDNGRHVTAKTERVRVSVGESLLYAIHKGRQSKSKRPVFWVRNKRPDKKNTHWAWSVAVLFRKCIGRPFRWTSAGNPTSFLLLKPGNPTLFWRQRASAAVSAQKAVPVSFLGGGYMTPPPPPPFCFYLQGILVGAFSELKMPKYGGCLVKPGKLGPL
jgi:hypothetical protein